MLENPSDRNIVASVIGLAGSLGVDVVGEGVETRQQADELTRLGCGHLQGYLYGRPVTLEQLPGQLARLRRSGERPRVPLARAGASTAAADTVVRGRVLALHKTGASLDTIAAALNSEGLRAPNGQRWHRTSVSRLL
jgi:hypothetical protein